MMLLCFIYGNPPPGMSVRDFLIRWIEVGRATLSGWHYSGGWGPGLGKKGMERWVKHCLSASWLWRWCEHLFMLQPLCRPARAEHTQTVVQCIAFVNSLSQHQEKELIQSLASVTARCGWGSWPWSSRTAHFPRMDTGTNTHVFTFLLCLLHDLSCYSANPTRTRTSVCFTLCYISRTRHIQ